MIRTHYDVLGIDRRADGAAVRAAYRERARSAHPDRPSGSAAEMAAVNEAYRVLGDPARREMYDRSLAGGTSTGSRPTATSGPAPTAPAPPTALPPARIPWRLIAFLSAAAAAFVFTASVLFEPAPERGPNGIIGTGSCVEVLANNDVREVPCSGDPSRDLVVETLVPYDERCPGGTTPYRDVLGRGAACLRSPSGP